MERIVKLVISIVFFSYDFLIKTILSIFRLKTPGTCVVIFYHSVHSIHIGKFTKQMDYLLQCAVPLYADYRGALKNNMHHVVLTFDDGFNSVAENAIPVLTKRKIPATIFVPVSFIGKEPLWIKSIEWARIADTVMSLDKILEIQNDLITIGSHCLSHSNLQLIDE